MDKKVVFIGGLFPEELKYEVQSKSIGGIQNAANNLQWNIVNGLVDNTFGELRVINSMYIGSFPKRYRTMCIKKTQFLIRNNKYNGINTSFLNLPVIKNWFRRKSIESEISKIVKKNSADSFVLIAYAMTSVMTKILLKYRNHKNVRTILIVPDLPEYMDFNKQNIWINHIKKFNIESMYKHTKYIDGFVLLTDRMKDKIYLKNNKYTILEGISNPNRNINNMDKKDSPNGKFIVFYSGGLNVEYGVKKLVDSVIFLNNENIILQICGSGPLSDYIQEISSKKPNICFLGLMENDKVLKYQENANLLINPRENTGEFTKYSFPSKIIEYMSAGVPVLMYKLDGVPPEYYKHVYLIDDFSSIADAISQLSKKSYEDMRIKAESAREFVMNCKNPIVQTKKIIDLTERL